MNIIICGAGAIGSHAAEVLNSDGYSVTVIDIDAARQHAIEDHMDVATLHGNAAMADILGEAGAADADLVFAATDIDEVNLLCASLGKGLGARTTIARVHHQEYLFQKAFDYQEYLGIDHLICPEYATASAIARRLRNPGAVAIEDLASGQIEMQEFIVSETASAAGRPLHEARLPRGSRLLVITRDQKSFIPTADHTVDAGDRVIMVGNSDVFHDARKLFHDDKLGRKKVVIMGGPPMSVWLCRLLKDRDFSIRLFETDQKRAEAVAEKLPWVTVLNADPTDQAVFDEEKIENADMFLAMDEDDENNILACAFAKSFGVGESMAVVQRSSYGHLLKIVGIDTHFSPRAVAVNEIRQLIDRRPLRLAASLAHKRISVFRVRIQPESTIIGASPRDIQMSPDWIIAAIIREHVAWVPEADETIKEHDILLVVGRHGREDALQEIIGTETAT